MAGPPKRGQSAAAPVGVQLGLWGIGESLEQMGLPRVSERPFSGRVQEAREQPKPAVARVWEWPGSDTRAIYEALAKGWMEILLNKL